MNKDDFFTRKRTLVWRYFECVFCGDSKKKYMAEEQPHENEKERSVDHRQRCSTCKKITSHREISPPKQS